MAANRRTWRGVLVGRGEIRQLLGVSHQRVVALTSESNFPAPLDELSNGMVWALIDVQAWAAGRGRTLNLKALTPPDDDTGGPESKP